jgi:hypothetical protein
VKETKPFRGTSDKTPPVQKNLDVLRKDMAAIRWCENASTLTGKQWKYVKVPQKEFEALQPSRLSDLAAFMPVVA